MELLKDTIKTNGYTKCVVAVAVLIGIAVFAIKWVFVIQHNL